MDDCTRRQLLGTCAAAVAAPALGAVLGGCARRVDPLRRLDLPAPVGGQIRLALASAPALTQTGGALSLHAAGAPPLLVARTTWGFVALEAQCTHAGCEVSWVPEDREAECPCHGSRFAADGSALTPPARGPLIAHAAAVDAIAQELVIDLQSVLVPGGAPLFAPVAADGTLRVAVADHPELQVTGGSVVGFAPGRQGPLAVVRTETGLLAYDAACTHQGCTLTPDPANRRFTCGCHGSAFSEQGKATKPPAVLPLQLLPPVAGKEFDGQAAVFTVR